jgi:hypothetical protein
MATAHWGPSASFARLSAPFPRPRTNIGARVLPRGWGRTAVLLRVGAEALDAARRAPGTDEDALVVALPPQGRDLAGAGPDDGDPRHGFRFRDGSDDESEVAEGGVGGAGGGGGGGGGDGGAWGAWGGAVGSDGGSGGGCDGEGEGEPAVLEALRAQATDLAADAAEALRRGADQLWGHVRDSVTAALVAHPHDRRRSTGHADDRKAL